MENRCSGVALLWGALAVTRSPSATLGILAQTRARGPLTTFTLGFVMVSDVVVVVLVAVVLACVRPLVDPAAAFSVDAFKVLAHDLFGASPWARRWGSSSRPTSGSSTGRCSSCCSCSASA